MAIEQRDGRLYIDGVAARALAKRFGTPLYAYSQDEILTRYRELSRAFGPQTLLCYALKANPNRAIGRLLAAQGAGADIVSGGELERALSAGFAAGKIVFSGVGKTKEELELGLRRGVLTFNIESQEELEALERVAGRLKRTAPISVRLNPDVDARTHPHITTGLAHNKFGVEWNEALALFEKAKKSRWLAIQGLQCHIGSQITSLRPYAAAAQSLARMAGELRKRGIELNLVDFGGGLGISYQGETPLDARRLAGVLKKTFSPWPHIRLLLEPGRFLVGDAGVLLTTVLYRKKTSRRRFIIVDAAMNDLARPALYGAYHPIAPVVKTPGKTMKADVVGPVCESGDFLARDRSLPPLAAGDVLAVLKAGAYGFSMSSQYNSRPRAAEVLVSGRSVRLIRRRETIKDIVAPEL